MIRMKFNKNILKDAAILTTAFLTLLLILFSIYVITVLAGRPRNHHKYKYRLFDFGNEEERSGNISVSVELSEQEYISFEYEDVHVLLSNLGTEEYSCVGSCYCKMESEDGYGRRNIGTYSNVLISGMRYLLVSITAVLAFNLAREHFLEQCVDEFADSLCPQESIVAEINECMKISTSEIVDYDPRSDDYNVEEDVFDDEYDIEEVFIPPTDSEFITDDDVGISHMIFKCYGRCTGGKKKSKKKKYKEYSKWLHEERKRFNDGSRKVPVYVDEEIDCNEIRAFKHNNMEVFVRFDDFDGKVQKFTEALFFEHFLEKYCKNRDGTYTHGINRCRGDRKSLKCFLKDQANYCDEQRII